MIDQATRDLLCERIVDGASLREVWREGFPSPWQILREAEIDPEFAQQYARAMTVRGHLKFERLDELGAKAAKAESAVEVQGLRLQSDNLKWTLGRMDPKKYGDRVESAHSGTITVSVAVRRLTMDGPEVSFIDTETIKGTKNTEPRLALVSSGDTSGA